MKVLLIILVAYLLGAIPFGYLIVRAKAGADIRDTGSGGTGATNVSRRAGKLAGVFTLLLDALKGTAAIWISRRLATGDQNGDWLVVVAAIAAIVGHMYPVWLGFHGGKGVATTVGIFLNLAPIALAFAGIIFVVIVASTRYVSAGSLAATAAMPLLVYVQSAFVKPALGIGPLIFASVMIALLIMYAHRGNIGRLIERTEPRFR